MIYLSRVPTRFYNNNNRPRHDSDAFVNILNDSNLPCQDVQV